MNLFVGVTDNDWFDFLRAADPPEVNFWRPSGQGFAALRPGEPFLFKLKAPRSAIAGGGFFVRYTRLPLTLMWDIFGQKNGAADFQTLAPTIRNYRRDSGPNPHVGCTVLTSPFFFDEADWIPVPESFSKNIVSGKSYDTATEEGRRLWRQVRMRLDTPDRTVLTPAEDQSPSPGQVAEDLAEYGAEYVARNRLGQSAFRTAVTDAYQRRGAITGEKTLPALQASHIKPYAASGPHRVDNGLLLRADVHQLFDAGYVTLTSNYCVEVSRRIREEFQNGDEYYAFQGTRLHLPDEKNDRPSDSFIEHHNTEIYVG
jgi:putative restriction endonuclease